MKKLFLFLALMVGAVSHAQVSYRNYIVSGEDSWSVNREVRFSFLPDCLRLSTALDTLYISLCDPITDVPKMKVYSFTYREWDCQLLLQYDEDGLFAVGIGNESSLFFMKISRNLIL